MTSSDTAPERRAGLRAGDELEIEFTDVLANGQGVGRASGIVVFCFGPLAGERARVRIVSVKQRYAVGKLNELLRESPERARPFCPVFGSCGGCQLQHLAYPAQLRWKRDTVRNALVRIGGIADPGVSETIGMAEPRAYRNKMAVVVEHRTTPPALGFYRQRSHDVVPIDACPIVSPRLDGVLGRLAAARSQPAVAAMLRDARHLVARSSSAADEAVLTITTQRRSDAARSAAGELLREVPGLAGVGNSYDLSSANAILGRRQERLGGAAAIEESVGGVRYRISAGSFFQVNVEVLERIFAALASRLERPGAMVDLYCGSGTFALYFARHGWRVTGIEENPHAVAEARTNAERNGLLERTRFETGRVEQLAGTAGVQRTLREADVVFLDPPRKGCDETVLAAIALAGARELWYLSCDAATLARDLKFLLSKGYRLENVQPFDMFPQTGHVETLVRLELSKD